MDGCWGFSRPLPSTSSSMTKKDTDPILYRRTRRHEHPVSRHEQQCKQTTTRRWYILPPGPEGSEPAETGFRKDVGRNPTLPRVDLSAGSIIADEVLSHIIPPVVSEVTEGVPNSTLWYYSRRPGVWIPPSGLSFDRMQPQMNLFLEKETGMLELEQVSSTIPNTDYIV